MNEINLKSKCISNWRIYRGLLWYEWRKVRGMHGIFFFVLLACIACNSLFFPKYNILPFVFLGYVWCFVNTLAFNASDEFHFALAVERKQLFWSRFIVGWVSYVIVLFLFLYLPIYLQWDEPSDESFVRIFLGFVEHLFVYSLIFLCLFSVEINRPSEQSEHRRSILLIPILISLYLMIFQIGFFYEKTWGIVSFSATFIFGGWVLWGGYNAYLQKEIGVTRRFLSAPIWIVLKPYCFIVFLFLVPYLVNAVIWVVGLIEFPRDAQSAVILLFPILAIIAASIAFHSSRRRRVLR